MFFRLTVLLIRSVLYATVMAALLWKLYAFKKLVEIGRLSKVESAREVATMTSIMVGVALLAWLFTWTYQEQYGAKIAILASGLLTGVGLLLFTIFVLSAVLVLARYTHTFFEGEIALGFMFIVIPVGAIAAAAVVALTDLLFRKHTLPQAT